MSLVTISEQALEAFRAQMQEAHPAPSSRANGACGWKPAISSSSRKRPFASAPRIFRFCCAQQQTGSALHKNIAYKPNPTPSAASMPRHRRPRSEHLLPSCASTRRM